MARLALAVIVTAAGVTSALMHHHHHSRRPALVQSDAPVPVIPQRVRARASRGERRQPLPVHAAHDGNQGVPRPPHPGGRARPAGSGTLADVTMYCATGNHNAAGRWPRLGDVAVLDRSIPFGTRILIDGKPYVVEDWIGSGSSWDIYGGSDPGCEQRALNFGRQHLRVVVG